MSHDLLMLLLAVDPHAAFQLAAIERVIAHAMSAAEAQQ